MVRGSGHAGRVIQQDVQPSHQRQNHGQQQEKLVSAIYLLDHLIPLIIIDLISTRGEPMAAQAARFDVALRANLLAAAIRGASQQHDEIASMLNEYARLLRAADNPWRLAETLAEIEER